MASISGATFVGLRRGSFEAQLQTTLGLNAAVPRCEVRSYLMKRNNCIYSIYAAEHVKYETIYQTNPFI